MKNLILVIAIAAIFSLQACGQKENVPAKTKASFTQKFPDATKVKWDKEEDNVWETEFKMDGKEYSANFDSEGKWMETEYEIKTSELPPAVKTTIDNEFKDYDIEEVEVSETPDGKVFELQMEVDENDIEVAISPNGKVVKKSEKKDNEGDEDNDDND
jgi:predicted small lipoprotein YifL/sulfur carrier protein ThiS